MKHYRINIPQDRDRRYKMFSYPGGEKQVQLLPSEFEAVRAADVLDVYAQIDTGEVMELALLTTALARFVKRSPLTKIITAKRNLYLPYLPYGRADRRFVEGDCHGLRAFGVMIDALQYDRVITYDVHSAEAFKNIDKLQENPIDDFVKQAIEKVGGKRGLTIILPDRGAERYIPMLKRLGIKRYAFGAKKRDPQTGKLSGFEFPPVRVKKGLIIDDICDGGGTFVGLAEVIRKQNPKAVLSLYTTHGIYSRGVTELKKHFDHVLSTGSFTPKNNVERKKI